MYKKSDKRRIYQLLDMYLSGRINESTFCHEFYCSYDLELDFDTLTEEEDKAFYELSEITSRFSEFQKDIEKYPDVYHTKEEVKRKVTGTKLRLEKYFKELKSDDTEGDINV